MKPILFNTEMVRAILAGRKTATRRVVKLKYCNTHLTMRTDKYGTRLIELQNEEPGVTTVRNPDGTTRHKLLAAADKYAAIVAAAKEWRVRWTQVAKDCVVQDLGRQQKTLCKRCKRVWVDKPGYCPQCAALVKSRDREIDRFAKAAAARRRERGWR